MNALLSTLSEYRNSEVLPTIETPPNPDLKISIVVPVSAEYENGNIFRFIESLSKQKADPSTYEVLCLVNNTETAAETNDPGYVENQKVLSILGYINGLSDLPEGLNTYRQHVLKRAREAGVVIQMVDLSTVGDSEFTTIGEIRDLGLDIATERFGQIKIGEQGIVAQMDADCTLEPRYIEKILHTFNDPKVETLFVRLDYHTPEGSSDLFTTSFSYQFDIALREYGNAIAGGQIRGAGGPQIIARVGAFNKIVGVPHYYIAEDFNVADALSKKTMFVYKDNIRVYTADRARTMGYDANARLCRLENSEYRYFSDIELLKLDLRLALLDICRIVEEEPEIVEDEEKVRELFVGHNLPFHMDLFKSAVLDKEKPDIPPSIKIKYYGVDYLNQLGIETSLSSNEWVDDFINFIKTNSSINEAEALDRFVHESDLRAQVRLHSNRMFILGALRKTYSDDKIALTAKEEEFLERNSWLRSALEKIVDAQPDYESAVQYMKEHYPEYVEEYTKSRLRRSTARLQAITSFVHQVRKNPESFPSSAACLDKLTTT